MNYRASEEESDLIYGAVNYPHVTESWRVDIFFNLLLLGVAGCQIGPGKNIFFLSCCYRSASPAAPQGKIIHTHSRDSRGP